MAKINMSSIKAKAAQCIESDKFQKIVDAKVDDYMLKGGLPSGKKVTIAGISMAAAKFIEVLQGEIQGHAMAEGGGGLNGRGLGSTAVSALTKLQHGQPVKIGRNKYQIDIWFGDSATSPDGKYLERDSLAPDEFPEGIKNIAALLNKGYSARNTVYGTWTGHGYADSFNIPSLTHREGLHFIESAIHNYMTNYSKEYGVIDIQIDDIYQ